MLSTGHSSIEAVAVFFLAVAFGALAALLFLFPDVHFFAHNLEFLGVEFDVGAVVALAVLGAEELVGKALAVELETLGLFAVALELALGVVARRGRLDADEGIVLEHVLEAVVLGELDGVELPQLDLAPLPLPEQLAEHILAAVGLALDHHQAALGADLVRHLPGVGRY